MRTKIVSYLVLTGSFVLTSISCSESFLEVAPPGTYSDVSLQNLKGAEGMLIATYAALDGSYFESWDNNYFNQHGGASNWVLGSVRGGDAYKGTEPSDGVDINPIERHDSQPSNPHLMNKWAGCYDGIAKANQTIRITRLLSDEVDATTKARIEAEARFLRGHFHFEAVKAFGVPAFVDETKSSNDLPSITNDKSIWPEIEADFQYAFENLPEVQNAAGRANKWAAAAYLAKAYMYQGGTAKWQAAKTIFDDMIGANPAGPAAKGKTAIGTPYQLTERYSDNFNISEESGNPESIFAYEASAFDGSIANGNYENTLNMPHGSSAPTSCCGFFQPSQSLVNAFQTTPAGVPLANYHSSLTNFSTPDLLNDEGLASGDPFTPDATTPLDPRLDWTVGRRGIPYLDWGPHPGNNWIRQVANGGPYSPKKNVPRIADIGSTAGLFDWGFTLSGLNVHIIRYADILLLAAEAEAELGNTAKALEYVNAVRTRAANPADFVTTTDANYVVAPYTAFGSPAEAVDAIRFERMLELGMEGHRFFDLARWDNLGSASQSPFNIEAYVNAYLSKEQAKRVHLENATFTRRHKYLPIPEYVITQGTVGGVKNIDQLVEWGGTRTLN
jgi:hypothetical protein